MLGHEHRRIPEREPGHREVEERPIMMSMDQVDLFPAGKGSQAMNRPPIDSWPLAQGMHRKPFLTKCFTELAHYVNTDEYESKVALEATCDPRRQQLGAAQLKAQKKLADC
jgi:hypothetical protein